MSEKDIAVLKIVDRSRTAGSVKATVKTKSGNIFEFVANRFSDIINKIKNH